MNLTPVIIWWFVILIIGLIGWPLAFSWLRFLPDRGFAFARPVGFLLIGYILWLGATFRLLQNNVGGVLITLLLAAGIGLAWHYRRVRARQDPSILEWLKQEWRYVVAVEVLFNVAFLFWVYYKAHNPNIETAGGEKWMEIAFINGILGSTYFPPQDPWLSGFGISYYYFGYVMMAAATQLANVLSTIAFNLYIPTLFAMTLAGAFGIVANLVYLYQLSKSNDQLTNPKPALHIPPVAMATGLVGAMFVAVLGNLIGVFEVLHKRGLLSPEFWRWLDIRDLKIPPEGPGNSWIPDRFIWWWRGSRVLTDYNLAGREQEVIDEFPFFSFLLGDVHPHVLALPFVLLVTALALNLIVNNSHPSPGAGQSPSRETTGIFDKVRQILENSWGDLRTALGGSLEFLLYAVAVGGLSFLNTWDFPIYLGVVGLSFILWTAQRKETWQAALLPGVIGTGMLGLAGFLLYLPFYATFQSQARGILPNLWNPTRLPQFFVFFGPFLVAAIVLLIVLSIKNKGWKQHITWSVPLAVFGPLLVMMLILAGILFNPAGRDYFEGILRDPNVQAAIGTDTIGAIVQESLWRRILNPWTFLLLGGLVGWALALIIGLSESKEASGSAHPIEKFVLILLVVGLGLPLVVEFIYLRDNFGYRMNTIFKFYFQAWVLLALASAFAVYYVSNNLKPLPRRVWQVAMALLVAGSMIYPVLAIPNKANNFQNEPTLNGIEWISQHRPGDYAGIAWLRQNATDGSVVLEAPGAPLHLYGGYNYSGRISAMTGLPTLLGWGGHQSQWRGNYDEPARREPDIELLFNTSDYQQARQLLDKYNITYVYVGPLERERFSPQGLSKFDDIMQVVFQQDDVTIYKRF